MFTLISLLSLIILDSSILFAIISKKMDLPKWLDVLGWIFILASIGVFLNNLFEPPYIQNYKAEIILRVIGSAIVLSLIFLLYKFVAKNGGK